MKIGANAAEDFLMISGKRVIVRVKGGLGNQLFCYAAARRLALVNDAELAIDKLTGFIRDSTYRRKYLLGHFQIGARSASRRETMQPFERLRRACIKYYSRSLPFFARNYLEQRDDDYDQRILEYRVRRSVYLDGLWQSEGYFKDIQNIIRNDLRIIGPFDPKDISLADTILSTKAAAIHIRWFDSPSSRGEGHNLSKEYYHRAIRLLERAQKDIHYYVFSDNPQAAVQILPYLGKKMTIVDHNGSAEKAHADLWLMAKCRYFIIANSTFGWWGAWLSENAEKIVVAPKIQRSGIGAWGFKGLIPSEWMTL